VNGPNGDCEGADEAQVFPS